MTTKTLLTIDEYVKTSFEMLTELVRGEVIEMGNPGARHGYVCANVIMIVGEWARRQRQGYVLGNDSGVVTERDPDTVRGPDCQFISARRLPQGLPETGYPAVPPDLAVEVVSDTDRWSEVIAKVGEFLNAGVTEVWVVDPRKEFVEVFRADRSPVRYEKTDDVTSDDVLPAFRCKASEFFAGI